MPGHASTGHAGTARRLREAGVRPTAPRVAVLEALAAEPDDATAQALHVRLRTAGHTIGLATVYRTLALLSDAGVVDALSHQRGESCYRLCSPGHHHHLVCSECHRVQELADCAVDEWLIGAAARHNFRPTSHSLEVVGLCEGCAARRG